MRVSRSTKILTTKEESDRIAREEAYASEIPGLTHIKAAENNTTNECDGLLVRIKRCRLSRAEQMRTHAGDRRFKCKKCNYVANWRSNLIAHERYHSGERPYKCHICKFATAQRSHLINHIRIHTGEKPYKCQICTFAAAQSSDLIRHNRIHTGEKPFKCRFCEYAATQSGSLNQHMRTQHEGALKLHAANSKKAGVRD